MTLFQIILVTIFTVILVVFILEVWFIRQISNRLHIWKSDKRTIGKTTKGKEHIIELEVEKATIALESYEAETRLEVKTNESETNDSLKELKKLRRKPWL